MKNISNTKCLFDTNILIYSLDRYSPMSKIAEELTAKVLEGKIEAVLAQQNIVELTNVLMKRLDQPRKNILQIIHTYSTKSKFTTISPQITTYNRFLDLCIRLEHRPRQFFDLYLAATMLDNDVTKIITANDNDFSGIPDITAINPWKTPLDF